MLDIEKIKCKHFVADQDGIDDLKNEFFDEAREFVYFRKGEWAGFGECLKFAVEWVINNPEFIAVSIALYPPSKELVKDIVKKANTTAKKVRVFFGKPKKGYISRRVIVTKGRLTKKQIADWEESCGEGSIATIPKAQGGKFRYIVNEKRYAIFTRMSKDDLRGIMGNDEETISILRDTFDREFIEAKIKSQ